MPAAWVKGKDGEKAWKKAKGIVSKEYGAGIEKSDPEHFYALVTTVYKNICKSSKFDCGVGEDLMPCGGKLMRLSEELVAFCEGVSASKLHLAKQTLGWHRQDASYLRRIAKEKTPEEARNLRKAAEMHDVAGDAYEVVLKTETMKDLKSAKKARMDALKFTRDNT